MSLFFSFGVEVGCCTGGDDDCDDDDEAAEKRRCANGVSIRVWSERRLLPRHDVVDVKHTTFWAENIAAAITASSHRFICSDAMTMSFA